MTTELAIESHALTKYYGAQRGVVDVDLAIRRGEVFGFLGPNGAGKSTTINLLVGQIRATSGSSQVLGLDCWRERDAVARRVGFLPGEFGLYERLTGSEMIAYLTRLRGPADSPRLAELADRFGAELDRPIADLSFGNKQKIGLLQALVHDPELVILDEPTLGLDPLVQRAFERTVRELADKGRTVFLSSHDLSEVERAADRVGIIREGRLVEVAAVSRLKELAVRRIDFEFAQPVRPGAFEGQPGVRHATVEGSRAHVEVEGSLAAVMKVAADLEILDMRVGQADLEEIFLSYYRDDAGSGGEPR